MTRWLAAAAAIAFSAPALAQDGGPAIGADVFVSTDADDNDLWRLGVDFDLERVGRERYAGIRVERARYAPAGTDAETRERIFARVAGPIGGDWTALAQVGTDFDTVIGSVSLHDEAAFRKELFVERDIVETRQGLALGLYSTFAGASLDVPVSDRTTVVVMGGVQDFTGENIRTHYRASLIQLVDETNGITLQLRARGFHDKVPGEYDYYAPGDYVQLLPVVQMRRRFDGWRTTLAAGWGGQKASGEDWRNARYGELRLSSPERSGWLVDLTALYSETPSRSAGSYRYGQFTFGIRRSL